MAQADSNNSTPAPVDSTRRRFLSQAACAAVGGAAVISQPAFAAGNPDAEIIAAGKAFELLLSKYLDVRFIWMRLAREARAEMEAKFPPDDFEGLLGHHPKYIFHHQALDRNGGSDASDRLSAIYQEMEPIADLIRSSEVETIEGLRAKTLVAIWECQPIGAFHDGRFDFDNPTSHWLLFDAAVAVTGLSDMASAIEMRLQADASISPEDEEKEEV